MRKYVATGLLAAAALVVGVAASAQNQAQPQGRHDHADGHAAHFMACAKECGECALACDACAAHCAKMLADGKKDHHRTLRTCQDCAVTCSAAACITAKAGPFSDLICTACADACKRCGDECEKMAADPMMKKCADECRRCEKACRDMLKHAAEGHGH